jgi:hypothetical protein
MSYFEDTEYATKNLIDLIAGQQKELEGVKEELANQIAKNKFFAWDYETSDLNDDFSEAHVMNAFRNMAQANQEADKLKVTKSRLEATIGTQQQAIQSMCGALLQIVRQGLSLVHGGPNNSPAGRQLSGIALTDIVWQARNQAIHYEKKKFHPPVVETFNALEAAFGAEFTLANHQGSSRAKQVVYLIGWDEFETFKNDMALLGLS